MLEKVFQKSPVRKYYGKNKNINMHKIPANKKTAGSFYVVVDKYNNINYYI